jgi:large subunit ribosomal protein L25
MIRKELSAAVRESFGKGPMRRLRAAGRTPAIAYGRGKEAVALQFETKELFQELVELQGRNAVLTLKIDDGSERNVIVKELQSDPVRDSLYHADFQEIDLGKPAVFSVPLRFTGKAKGVDFGGIQTIENTAVQLKGLPLAIPDDCVVDVRPLAIGDKITAGQLAIPEGVSLISDPDAVCVSIVAP